MNSAKASCYFVTDPKVEFLQALKFLQALEASVRDMLAVIKFEHLKTLQFLRASKRT